MTDRLPASAVVVPTADTLKEDDGRAGRPGTCACITKPVPPLLTVRPMKVAMPPLTVAGLVAPVRTAPVGLVERLSVTWLLLSPVSTLPYLSSVATSTTGLNAVPKTMLPAPPRS